MALTRNEFSILNALIQTPEKTTQRKIAEVTGMSLGTVNATLGSLSGRGLVEDGMVTPAGANELEPYRVRGAIVMAAGLSSRFAPISYEKPKGLLRVRGSVLIERQIEQLLEAGITDITVVVGYKKEYFFYLAMKYGVRIVVNPEYETRNNNSTLWRVRDRLASAYICSSDIYYTENPFERYVYESYYACEHVDGPTKEWCLKVGPRRRITGCTIGGADADIMLGHAYFDASFGTRFGQILEEEYDRPETADKLWETIYLEHLRELPMVARRYPAGSIHEFDNLDELREFDPSFLSNVDSEIFDNIVSVLHCDKNAIHDFYPLKQGLTNLSCHFAVGEGDDKAEYVYRHPGVGTEKLISRAGEHAGLKLAKELGLDDTFIYMNEDEGWKLSRFVPNARNLDTSVDEELDRAMKYARKLHESGATLERKFDFYDEGKAYERTLAERGPIDVPGYWELEEKAHRLREYAREDGLGREVISHNDFFELNFLVDQEGNMSLIDWEYAGMSDEANDIGTFCVCCQLSPERIEYALSCYFGRTPTFAERRHFWVFVVLAGWCWYVWSLVKEAEGTDVGEWFFIYYSYAADYVDKVLDWYEHYDNEGNALA